MFENLARVVYACEVRFLPMEDGGDEPDDGS